MTNIKDKQRDEAWSAWEEVANARINLMIDSLCKIRGIDYNGLADELGINRGWFTRMRRGGICQFKASTLNALANAGQTSLAALAGDSRVVESGELFGWMFAFDYDPNRNKTIE